MGKQRYKKITAGKMVREILYTPVYPSDIGPQRSKKTKIQTAARKKINLRCAWQKLKYSLAANFSKRDLVVTLTYNDCCLPTSREEARKCIKKFLTQLRVQRNKKNDSLKYIYNIESLHSDGRWHHHLIINHSADFTDFETIKSLWNYGDDIDFAVVDDYGYAGLAQYVTKEAREFGLSNGCRSWTPSQNLVKPDVEPSSWVPASFRLAPPVNSFVLEREAIENEYGRFEFIEYMLTDVSVPVYSRPQKTE